MCRLAKLSERKLIDGTLECLYHGWQLDDNGKCVKNPQICVDCTVFKNAPIDYVLIFLRNGFSFSTALRMCEVPASACGESSTFPGCFFADLLDRANLCLLFGFEHMRKPPFLLKLFPQWHLNQLASKILEQDMSLLSSHNEILLKKKVPAGKLYINLKESDIWVAEYRKWMDKVGHGMPYYFGHNLIS